jgi:hypothetical protein
LGNKGLETPRRKRAKENTGSSAPLQLRGEGIMPEAATSNATYEDRSNTFREFLLNQTFVDKCDWERKRPLLSINERLLSAGSSGNFLEIKHLHKLGADLQYRGENDAEVGLAHYAAKRGDLPLMKYLFHHGAFPQDHVLETGQTVVHMAAFSGKVGMLKWMLKHHDNFKFHDVDNNMGGVTHYAVLGDSLDVIKFLYRYVTDVYPQVLNQIDNNGVGPIAMSQALGRADIYDFLKWAGLNKKASKVKSLFFRSVSSYKHSMLLESGPPVTKERACLRLQRNWREKKKTLDKERLEKFETQKGLETELYRIQSLLEEMKTEEERNRKLAEEEARNRAIRAKNEAEFIAKMRGEEALQKMRDYRLSRVNEAKRAVRCVEIAEEKALKLTVNSQEILNEAVATLSLAKGVPSGTEKIEYLGECLKQIAKCFKMIEKCEDAYGDALKWKFKTLQIAYDIELENFCGKKKISYIYENIRFGRTLSQMVDVARLGYEKMCDNFPDLEPGERAELHKALASANTIRVETGVLVLKETKEQKEAKKKKKKKTKAEIEALKKKSESEYGQWVRHAFDCIEEAEKHLVKARFYHDEAVSIESRADSNENAANQMLHGGIEMPLGYDPFCSKLNLPPFARRIKRSFKPKEKRRRKVEKLEEMIKQLAS